MKGNFQKPQKFNEFNKLSTKTCMSRTMNDQKERFTIMKANLTAFLQRLFLRNKTKNIQAKVNNVYLKHSVVAGLLGDRIIANIHIAI